MTGRGYGFATSLHEVGELDPAAVIGELTTHASRRRWGTIDTSQVRAWEESWAWLTSAATELLAAHDQATDWTLCLEYEIPRRGGRIDAVLLAGELIFVLEFKAVTIDAAARRQVEDYALELIDFHAASHDRTLLPIACSLAAPSSKGKLGGPQAVASVSTCKPTGLASLVLELFQSYHREGAAPIDTAAWLAAPYCPTPTIVEAARALYAGHSVRDISHSQASADHLAATEQAVARCIASARARGGRSVCFITGVPGAGKTLAGLNLVHQLENSEQATFLSGNGPLVKVLQKVLARDLAARGEGTVQQAERRASTLVTNVHRWLDLYIDRQPDAAPPESVVVFDEAQRAWSRQHSMRKFGRDSSEPEMMLDALSRREGPSTMVALVGGGQEINTGEAGLAEWGRALTERFQSWEVAVSPELLEGRHATVGSYLFDHTPPDLRSRLRTDPDLHLAISQRSFRTELLNQWVEHVLANEPSEAMLVMEHLFRYPIVATRSLAVAREWLRERSRGLRRCGLLASSGARRLRPYGISVREPVDEPYWFLQPSEDVRSSNFLELAITEFGIQGLEVDWSCLAWGGDLTRAADGWSIERFRGSEWTNVRQETDRRYAVNRYRVLLTRAREGMVIWIPEGDVRDRTREPRRYDGVFDYLRECGVKTI